MNKMLYKGIMLAFAAFAFGSVAQLGAQDSRPFKEVEKLFDYGMYSHARQSFDELGTDFSSDPQGYAVLCDVKQGVLGYQRVMNRFIEDNPQSALIPQIIFSHSLNLFDAQNYKAVLDVVDDINPKHLSKPQRVEYTFKKAYSLMETGNLNAAIEGFKEVERYPLCDYTAPSRYSLGYINYELKKFREAVSWFEQSLKDGRFKEMSSYYIMECRFMLGDHDYVATYGDAMYNVVPKERKPHLARIISESWLVKGNASNARKYLELNAMEGGQPNGRADWFYQGSVLYAVNDFQGAIDSFSMMTERTDSIGQIANYQLGYSYIQTRNKVAALDAFRDASEYDFDLDIAEDAFFNYAKLAFDLNDDSSVFSSYLKKYSDLDKGERIYGYMAVAALHDRDYASAIESYDKIDELDSDMKNNYMKANYLRAEQLIERGSYRKAIPCLKSAIYYSKKNSRLNQLSRFWLAESYYRNDQYREARDVFSELYNVSALRGMPEAELIPYNLAYCYYKEGNYIAARKWFSAYLEVPHAKYRKDALVRKADCHFIERDYKGACTAYDQVLDRYFDPNDIYPYYQSAISYGLLRNQDKKIALLSNVMQASPESEFYAEALYELGRSYEFRGEDENAFNCFSMMTERVKDNTYLAKAYIEMGSISRNQSQLDEALGYYKTVVEQMPLSGYAEDALAAIESIYQTRNEPEEFIAYIDGIGKGGIKSADEKETMIFNSAEQIFLSENYQKALVSLHSYVDKYPDGQYVYKADFYMAESYKGLGMLEQASDSYKKVISEGEGSFVELSMLNFANIAYKLERWEDAYGGYSSLHSSALLENNSFVALAGMMRSAFKGHDWKNAVQCADKVLDDSRSDKHLAQEAQYIKAKSFLATSRRTDAFAVLEVLSADLSSTYGAEAAYMIIQDCYDRGEFKSVEDKVYDFADAASSQTYWLARSFVVLGDSFVERGEYEQAKATFESIRDGYSADNGQDDVLENVKLRLEKLNELMNEAV